MGKGKKRSRRSRRNPLQSLTTRKQSSTAGKQPHTMSVEDLIQRIYTNTTGENELERFCFILGAGASRNCGIRTGEELMQHWRKKLSELDLDTISKRAKNLNIEMDELRRLLDPNVPMKNDDYFTLYDLMYAGNPSEGTDFIEGETSDGNPSQGYFDLYRIISKTRIKIVITTNFDRMLETASSNKILTLTHENIALLLDPVRTKPVLAKIHRDLLCGPMNSREEMKELNEKWKQPLSEVFHYHTPIVIGYAGGDRTLMSLLFKLDLKDILWCYVGDLAQVPENVKELVQKKEGHLIQIDGFDQFMAALREKYNIPDGTEVPKPASDLASLFVRAEKDMEEGYPRDAIVRYDVLINSAERSKAAKYYHRRSTAYHLIGEYDQAIRDENEAIQIYKESNSVDKILLSKYYYALGITYYDKALMLYSCEEKDEARKYLIESRDAKAEAARLYEIEKYQTSLAATIKKMKEIEKSDESSGGT